MPPLSKISPPDDSGVAFADIHSAQIVCRAIASSLPRQALVCPNISAIRDAAHRHQLQNPSRSFQAASSKPSVSSTHRWLDPATHSRTWAKHIRCIAVVPALGPAEAQVENPLAEPTRSSSERAPSSAKRASRYSVAAGQLGRKS